MSCDMCGADKSLVKAMVEGVELSVCPQCAKMGTVLIPNKRKYRPSLALQKNTLQTKATAPEQFIVKNYAFLIKGARERLGLKQESLAKQLGLKESILHKMESGQFRPSIRVAKLLERKLNITLIESISSERIQMGASKTETRALTLGDVIKIRKR